MFEYPENFAKNLRYGFQRGLEIFGGNDNHKIGEDTQSDGRGDVTLMIPLLTLVSV